MDTLLTPWRYAYVTAPHPKLQGCIFCTIPEENDDEKRFIVHRGKFCYVMLNTYPYASGHLMVIPYRHISDITQLTSDEAMEFHTLTVSALRCITEAMHPQGFNMGINMGAVAGAGIAEHLHRHIVPRWVGDCNFMQFTGNTRVVPVSLPECWKLFREHWQ